LRWQYSPTPFTSTCFRPEIRDSVWGRAGRECKRLQHQLTSELPLTLTGGRRPTGVRISRENPTLTIACRSVEWWRSAEPTISSSLEGSPTEPAPGFQFNRAKSFRFQSRFVRDYGLCFTIPVYYSGLPVDGSQTGCQREAATDRRPCGAGNRSGTHCSLFRAGGILHGQRKSGLWGIATRTETATATDQEEGWMSWESAFQHAAHHAVVDKATRNRDQG